MVRYLAYAICVILALVATVLAVTQQSVGWSIATIPLLALVALGTIDIVQRRATLRRLYPLMARFRYGLESFRPEIRQYFIEDDQDEVPFSRQQRALVYQRSKNVSDVVPFGSELPMYGSQYEWINHSLAPAHAATHDFRVPVGDERAQPYAASVFNISAMSFGSLSANAIRALNLGAKRGNFYHDTGEGAISAYHREHGGDLVWEIGSGYFGCRDAQGRFDEDAFARNAAEPQVRMLELKLSQGAKPGHGGLLPGAKVTPEIAQTRGIPVGVDCESPAAHSTFSTPLGLLEFIERMRTLAGGKPTGFKLAIGHPWEWFGIARAMLDSGILPDFIVVDGAEGGTGAAPSEFINHVGLPLQEALMLVHNTLVGIGLRDRIRVAAAGKVTSGFDIARAMAMGADWCNAGRGFMFALGCIQSRSCHTDKCPTGVATQDPARWSLLDVPDKSDRVFHFHENTLRALRDMIGAAGLEHPMQIGPEHILRRVSPTEVRSLAALYRFLEPGELLAGVPEHAVFKAFWPSARADSFAPPARASAMHVVKRTH